MNQHIGEPAVLIFTVEDYMFVLHIYVYVHGCICRWWAGYCLAHEW